MRDMRKAHKIKCRSIDLLNVSLFINSQQSRSRGFQHFMKKTLPVFAFYADICNMHVQTVQTLMQCAEGSGTDILRVMQCGVIIGNRIKEESHFPVEAVQKMNQIKEGDQDNQCQWNC